MKIQVTLDVSESRSSQIFDLEDLGITQLEWELMSTNDRRSALQVEIDKLPNNPYWVLDNFEERI